MARRPLRFAFTPTHDRPAMYAELVENITPQVDQFITIRHGQTARDYGTHGVLLDYTETLPDLSVMWNMGLDEAHRLAKGRPYYVAGLNDDALVADDWFDRMIEAIERDGTAGASTPRSPYKGRSIFGGAWIVKGHLGIRMSGVARWYYTDDEIQKLCQAAGGFSIVPGVHAVNRLADKTTRQNRHLRAINSEDWPRFKAKYGMPESPWENADYHVVISAPTGDAQHIIDTLDGRPYTVLTDGWETEQLATAASMFPRFVFIKESTRLLPGFWDRIDATPGSAWFFPHPSCYMGIYDATTLRRMLRRLPTTRTKEDSILNESRIHSTIQWPTIFPDVTDLHPLRMDGPELVIGNQYIEKSKGTARCRRCATSREPGVCPHLQALAVRRPRVATQARRNPVER